jgi:YgiT-type zinc finger domain-containing protein
LSKITHGERCEYCNGLIVEKRVDLTRKVGENYVLIENVPAGVCTECGTRYYAANVLKTVEETIVGGERRREKSLWRCIRCKRLHQAVISDAVSR